MDCINISSRINVLFLAFSPLSLSLSFIFTSSLISIYRIDISLRFSHYFLTSFLPHLALLLGRLTDPHHSLSAQNKMCIDLPTAKRLVKIRREKSEFKAKYAIYSKRLGKYRSMARLGRWFE